MLAMEVDSKQLGNNVVLAKGAVFLKKRVMKVTAPSQSIG